MTDNTLCACGCGGVISPFDSRGRPRHFIVGHAARMLKYKLIVDYILPTSKICTICLIDKSINQFYYKTYTSKTTGEKYKRYRAECIVCSKLKYKEYRTENSDLVNSKKQVRYQNDLRYRIQSRIATYRKNSCVPSDLTVDYLIDLYNQQDGYCFYTGSKMILGWVDDKIHPDTLSLDKKDPNKGYVCGNVVWCSFLANTMKQNMNEQEFYAYMKNILHYRHEEP